MSVFGMSGSNLRTGGIKGYKQWMLSLDVNPDAEALYRDVLAHYDKAINDAENVIRVRGCLLRRINLMTLLACVFGSVGVIGLML